MSTSEVEEFEQSTQRSNAESIDDPRLFEFRKRGCLILCMVGLFGAGAMVMGFMVGAVAAVGGRGSPLFSIVGVFGLF